MNNIQSSLQKLAEHNSAALEAKIIKANQMYGKTSVTNRTCEYKYKIPKGKAKREELKKNMITFTPSIKRLSTPETTILK